MKKLMMVLAVSVAVLGVTTSAMAQGAGPKGGGGLQGGKQGKQAKPGQGLMLRGKLQQEVLAKLNLTENQKSKWETLSKEVREEMGKLRGKGQGDQKPDRKALMEKMKGYQEKYMAILTPKQQEQYKKLMQEAVEKFRKDNAGKNGGGKTGGDKAGGGGGR